MKIVSWLIKEGKAEAQSGSGFAAIYRSISNFRPTIP